MKKTKLKKRKIFLPLSRLFPNMVTIAGLCCGLSSVRFAFDGKFEIAVTLIFLAAIIDGMDGRIARFLNSTSIFGAQLDSLSDFVCFGVSPAIILYMWRMHEVRGLGWSATLFFVVCCALRLARFNTNLLDENKQLWEMKFFTGVPSPAGAMLALMPLFTSFYLNLNLLNNSIFCIIWVALVGILMASRVPTFAAKRLVIHHEWVLPIMILCGFTIVIILIEPWIMLTIAGLIYIATIPMSIRYYRKLSAMHKNNIETSNE